MRRIAIGAALAAIFATPFVFVAGLTVRLNDSPIANDTMVRMPCSPTVELALTNGRGEDDTCTIFVRDGIVVHGPLWAMEPGDTRVTP